jgi:cellulose synthase/poly-beta-1,6-N-acetylglucosamine synthase-like glycosyltransferase
MTKKPIDIEITAPDKRTKAYRFFEALPGICSWLLIVSPLILSAISPIAATYFVLAFLVLWFFRAIAITFRTLQGFWAMEDNQKRDWSKLLDDADNEQLNSSSTKALSWHKNNIALLKTSTQLKIASKDVVQVLIIAVYNETIDVLLPTMEALVKSKYDIKHQVVVAFAYEERGGRATEQMLEGLVAKYSSCFRSLSMYRHPSDTPGEMIGKGGNITHTARLLTQELIDQEYNIEHVLVTTLDCDNRVHPQYLSAAAYAFIVCPDRLHTSFQPVLIYSNNIWDVPAPMRVIATGNSYYTIILSLRPHLLRNFSSHAQPLSALIDTDFWSVKTIVEDGHQFWRTYIRYEGQHEVAPIFVPIYQDAVLSVSYRKTLKAQFVQLRRWAWGASDLAYLVEKGFFRKNNIPKLDLVAKVARLLENHVSWAAAPILLAISALMPQWVNIHADSSFLVAQLPLIASRIQTLATLGILATLYVSLKSLPPKPAKYHHGRTVLMVVQWIFLPVTSILYNSLAALNAQTRLMFGKYIGKFDLTEKATKK